MSDPVVPRTWPYRPSGGWTNDEIWNGSSGPAADDTPVTGATSETKDRLKMIGLTALQDIVDVLKPRVAPETQPGRAPGEVQNAGGGPGGTSGGQGPETHLKITGKAPTLSTSGMILGAAVGVVLILALVFEGRHSPAHE